MSRNHKPEGRLERMAAVWLSAPFSSLAVFSFDSLSILLLACLSFRHSWFFSAEKSPAVARAERRRAQTGSTVQKFHANINVDEPLSLSFFLSFAAAAAAAPPRAASWVSCYMPELSTHTVTSVTSVSVSDAHTIALAPSLARPGTAVSALSFSSPQCLPTPYTLSPSESTSYASLTRLNMIEACSSFPGFLSG